MDLQTVVVGVLVVTCAAFALRGLLRQGKAAMSGCAGCGKCATVQPVRDEKPLVFHAASARGISASSYEMCSKPKV